MTAYESVEHGEDLDAELARIEAEAEVAKANARGQRKGGRPPASKPASGPADDAGDAQSWDEFWAEVKRAEAAEDSTLPTTVIRGVEVAIPYDLPLRFDHMLEEVEDSESDEDVHSLVAELFGDDVFDQWVDAGMGSLEFRVVLLWGIANGRGRTLSFREAYEGVRSEGKSLSPAPANRAQRRASERSGGRSKPTSSASTGSRRKK